LKLRRKKVKVEYGGSTERPAAIQTGDRSGILGRRVTGKKKRTSSRIEPQNDVRSIERVRRKVQKQWAGVGEHDETRLPIKKEKKERAQNFANKEWEMIKSSAGGSSR